MSSSVTSAKLAESLKNKMTNKKKEVDFMKTLAERNQLIEEPRKLGNYRKMKPYNDGITDMQVDLYRALTAKRDKKEKAIRAAEE